MPGSTSRYFFPYPVGTDKVGDGENSVKGIADLADTRLVVTDDFGINTSGRRAYNLCSYNEAVSNGTGYILIQTNLSETSLVMTKLNIVGLVYEPDNAYINIDIKFYPFSDASMQRVEVINRGSFCAQSVQIVRRNTDGKVAIAILPFTNGNFWNYPKLAVDGVFGHAAVAESTYTTGWSISRIADLTGYTVKSSPWTPRPASEDSGWINIPFQAGWSQYGPGNGWDAQYRRIGGVVHLRGLVLPPTAANGSSTPIAFLPLGFRPKANTLRGTIDNASPRMLYVYWDGKLQVPAGGFDGYAWFSLEGVSFPAEQ